MISSEPCPKCGGAVTVTPDRPSALHTLHCTACGNSCMVHSEYGIPLTEEQRREADTLVAPEVVAASPNDVLKLRRLLPSLQSSPLGHLREQLVEQGLRWPLRCMALTEARIVAAEAAAVGLTLDWQMVLRTQPAREVPLEEVLKVLVGHGKDFRRDYRITVPLERGLILIRPHGTRN